LFVLSLRQRGVLAGSGVRQRFQELRLPAAAPPMGLWVLIGVAYYVIAFTLLVRLQIVEPTSAAPRSLCF